MPLGSRQALATLDSVGMRLVLIEWEDIVGVDRWQHMEDIRDADDRSMRCTSVGWLARDGKKTKVIVPHLSDAGDDRIDPQGCGILTIPTNAVLRILPLPDPRKKRR